MRTNSTTLVIYEGLYGTKASEVLESVKQILMVRVVAARQVHWHSDCDKVAQLLLNNCYRILSLSLIHSLATAQEPAGNRLYGSDPVVRWRKLVDTCHGLVRYLNYACEAAPISIINFISILLLQPRPGL